MCTALIMCSRPWKLLDAGSPLTRLTVGDIASVTQSLERCMGVYRADHVLPAVGAVDAGRHQLGVQLLVQRRPRLALRVLELCSYQVRLHAMI